MPDDNLYSIIINHEEQYSLLPLGRPVPSGWRAINRTATRDVALDFIETVWTDLRPLDVRERVEELEKSLG